MKMNRIIIFICSLFVFPVHAETVDYIDMQLDAQINELIQRRDKLKADLEACEKNTRGYKIAGISTLAATGIGVVGNIKLAKEIEEQKLLKGRGGSGGYNGSRGDGGGHGLGHISQEQKEDLQCKVYCEEDPDMAALYECEC